MKRVVMGKNLGEITNGWPLFRTVKLILAAALVTTTSFAAETANHEVANGRPKVIVTTDGEIDDQSSMIRFLLYSCDVNVQAIIENNSIFQRHGHSKEPWYDNQLAAYAEIYPNLIKHNRHYPSPEELRKRSFVGDENHDHLKNLDRLPQKPGGAVEFSPADWPDTPGSDAIVAILLGKDPSPVHIQVWGGGNTVSRALHKLKQENPVDYKRAASKAVMYNIWYQDDAGNYIETHHPEVTMIHCDHFGGTWSYDSQPNTHDFITENVKTGHGPLGALYPQTYVSEGDSPAFFYTIDNGLRNHEHPGFGGWGGRFKKVDGLANVYTDAEDKGGKKYQLTRWIEVVNQDFKARMDWCVKEFKDANHAPVAKVKGALMREVKAGETVKLAATATDPDGHQLSCKWWQYADAGSITATLTIANSDSLGQASFVAPNEPGKQVHIILEVTDNGTPPLTGYQRVIFSIK